MVWVIFSLKPTNRYTYTCNTKMRNIYVPRQAYRILVLVDVSYVNSILKILYNIYTKHNTIIIIYTIYKQWMELMYNLLITYSKILVYENFHRIHNQCVNIFIQLAYTSPDKLSTELFSKYYENIYLCSIVSNLNNTSRYTSLIWSQSVLQSGNNQIVIALSTVRNAIEAVAQ